MYLFWALQNEIWNEVAMKLRFSRITEQRKKKSFQGCFNMLQFRVNSGRVKKNNRKKKKKFLRKNYFDSIISFCGWWHMTMSGDFDTHFNVLHLFQFDFIFLSICCYSFQFDCIFLTICCFLFQFVAIISFCGWWQLTMSGEFDTAANSQTPLPLQQHPRMEMQFDISIHLNDFFLA